MAGAIACPHFDGDIVVTSEPDHIKRIFGADSDTFETLAQTNLSGIVGKRSVIVTAGATHRRQRKLLTPPLGGARLRAFGATIQEIADAHVSSLSVGAELRALDLVTDFTLDLSRREALAVLEQQRFPVRLLSDFGEASELLSEDDGRFEEAVQHSLESRIFCLEGIRDVHDAGCSVFAAEQELWQVDNVFRTGPGVMDVAVLTDDEIIHSLCGFSGANDTRLIQAVDPTHKMQFEQFRATLEGFLERYGWWDEVDEQLRSLVPAEGTTVFADAYCPAEFLSCARFHGFLAWDGVTIPPDVEDVLPDMGPGGNMLRMMQSSDDDIIAVVEGYGLVFPVVSSRTERGFARSCEFASLSSWYETHSEAARALARRLGPIVMPSDA